MQMRKKTQIEYRLPSTLSKTRASCEHVHTHRQLKASTTLNSPYSAPIHTPKPTKKSELYYIVICIYTYITSKHDICLICYAHPKKKHAPIFPKSYIVNPETRNFGGPLVCKTMNRRLGINASTMLTRNIQQNILRPFLDDLAHVRKGILSIATSCAYASAAGNEFREGWSAGALGPLVLYPGFV